MYIYLFDQGQILSHLFLLSLHVQRVRKHPLHDMVVNHDMHRPMTGKRHAETDAGSGEKARTFPLANWFAIEFSFNFVSHN